MHKVYVVGPEDAGWPVKVGHAGNLKLNLAQLQRGCWVKLKTWHSFEVAKSRWGARAREQAIHRYLENKKLIQRLSGEWFNMNEAQAKEIIGAYLERVDLIKNMTKDPPGYRESIYGVWA